MHFHLKKLRIFIIWISIIKNNLSGKYKVFWDSLYDEYGSYLFNTNGLFNPIECSCGSIYGSYIYGIDLLAIPNMDAFCLASIEHDLIEYKSFNAFKINFSAFIERASKDGVLVYSK